MRDEISVIAVKGSDYFRNRHRELKVDQKIKRRINEAYYENLKKGVLYWNGREWTTNPSLNRVDFLSRKL